MTSCAHVAKMLSTAVFTIEARAPSDIEEQVSCPPACESMHALETLARWIPVLHMLIVTGARSRPCLQLEPPNHRLACALPVLRRSLLERALSIRLVYQKASMARALSFEYLNRQLVWHELSQLLLLTLPLLNAAALKRFVLQRLPPLALRLTGPTGTGAPALALQAQARHGLQPTRAACQAGCGAAQHARKMQPVHSRHELD